MGAERDDATRLLRAARGGDERAAQALFPQVYAELRRVAEVYLGREPSGHTLQPTALVHEAYLRLVDETGVGAEDQRHFLGIAARVMRRVLVDHARARNADKRGGGRLRVTLDESVAATRWRGVEILDLDEALARLEQLDERLARVVELRVLLGMTLAETGAVLGIAKSTVDKDWAAARAWLRRELEKS